MDEGSHVYRYELGAMAAWSGALPRVLRGRQGMLTAEQISAAVAPDVYYLAKTALLVLENSHNHAGGTVVSVEQQAELIAMAQTFSPVFDIVTNGVPVSCMLDNATAQASAA